MELSRDMSASFTVIFSGLNFKAVTERLTCWGCTVGNGASKATEIILVACWVGSALLLPCEITSGTATKGRDYSASGVLGLVGTKELRPMSARHELPSELSLRPNVDFVVAVVPFFAIATSCVRVCIASTALLQNTSHSPWSSWLLPFEDDLKAIFSIGRTKSLQVYCDILPGRPKIEKATKWLGGWSVIIFPPVISFYKMFFIRNT